MVMRHVRKNFSKLPAVIALPDLIEVQRSSYERFLQKDIAAGKREESGIQGVLRSVFPIRDYNGRAELDFVSYELEEPRYSCEECRRRGMTYASLLKLRLRLIIKDVDEETGKSSVREVKEKSVYMGDVPLMAEDGTFIINGATRVVVSQMHRSPGVILDHDKGKTHASGKFLYAAHIIPYRGSWLDFDFDAKDVIYVRIDRRRKLPVTALLLALPRDSSKKPPLRRSHAETEHELAAGMSVAEILEHFHTTVRWRRRKAQGVERKEVKEEKEGKEDRKEKKGKKGKKEKEGKVATDGGLWRAPYTARLWRGFKAVTAPLCEVSSGRVLLAKGESLSARAAERLEEEGVREAEVADADMVGRFLARDACNAASGEVVAGAGDALDEEVLEALAAGGVDEIVTLDVDADGTGAYIRNTLAVDKNRSRREALFDIYRVIRPGEPPTAEAAEALLYQQFFDPDRYNLSAVGRVKMNMRLGLECPDSVRVLRSEDLLQVVKTLVDVKDGRGEVDDIDHLGNRRVRSVGELMENQYRLGLTRMERAIRERMGMPDVDKVVPDDLINARPVVAAIREFFGSSQLSQFMDQTNPLAEVTHKRRLSALGPGGLTRERAGFEVRDVHPSHYGRICPVETPEGPNIGLINSLATYARVNRYGFIETPYRKVKAGRLTGEVVYMSALEEGRYAIAEANVATDKSGALAGELVTCRCDGEFEARRPQDVDYVDVSPSQIVSVAASLVPFLENDDANRALMGSNMQRQAVPLIMPEAPIVGTGMEEIVARNSGAAVSARRAGFVDQVDASRIVIRATEGKDDNAYIGVDIYNLRKFQRSNQSTCMNQRSLVHCGDRVEAGEILADGPSTDKGELALGRNILVGFMPWHGYNFEDSILVSERIVCDDVFTSIHIENFETYARDTKLGPEEITRDIPNVGEDALRHLDEVGIVHVGAEVHHGDILVGKVTPRGESPMTPEEKLLRAIFGEKASDMRDSSLRVPPGTSGTVIEVRVFSRRGIDKDERGLASEHEEVKRLTKDRNDERAIYERDFNRRLREKLLGRTAVGGLPPEALAGMSLEDGVKLTARVLEKVKAAHWRRIQLRDDAVMREVETMRRDLDAHLTRLEKSYEDKVEGLQAGDELPPGVLKLVKVFVALKRKIQPGDKMAGRHGNKGVVSRIVPIEDMPHTEDGMPLDILLNPLGVPSRMNVGQILETHLGWAAAGLGRRIGALAQAVYDARLARGGKGGGGDLGRGGDADARARFTALRESLAGLYGDRIGGRVLSSMNDKALLDCGVSLAPGVPCATPVFDGALEADIVAMLAAAGLDASGRVTLRDGRGGEVFARPVTVGYMYMLKLNHLVDDKIHARSIGPYSLVTQQPLGGKAQFGGQRFGEMEVWALEAYGAAYTLQEMLTIKSDDVAGRTRTYEAIVRGEDTFEAGIPESFNVLVMELRSLGLDVDLKETVRETPPVRETAAVGALAGGEEA